MAKLKGQGVAAQRRTSGKADRGRDDGQGAASQRGPKRSKQQQQREEPEDALQDALEDEQPGFSDDESLGLDDGAVALGEDEPEEGKKRLTGRRAKKEREAKKRMKAGSFGACLSFGGGRLEREGAVQASLSCT